MPVILATQEDCGSKAARAKVFYLKKTYHQKRAGGWVRW
jgi:hypothetical protein